MTWNLIKLLEKEEKEKSLDDDEEGFKDDDPDKTKSLPDDVISKIKKTIRTGAKDFDKEWKNAIELVDWSLEENSIIKPIASLTSDRWYQYKQLLSHAVKELKDVRGDKNWKLIP